MSNNPGSWPEQSREFFTEVQGELKKVTWPSQRELIAGTISVVVVVTILAIALGLVDWGLAYGVSWILGNN